MPRPVRALIIGNGPVRYVPVEGATSDSPVSSLSAESAGIVPIIVATSKAAATAATVTWNISVPEAENPRLFVVIANAGAPSPSGVTVDAAPGTSIQGHFTSDVEYKLFDCGVPVAGTHEIIGTFSGSTQVAGIAVVLENGEGTISGAALGIRSYDRLSLASTHHRSLNVGSGGNDLILAFGAVAINEVIVPDSPAVVVDSINLPSNEGTLFVISRAPVWPGNETPLGFTFPLSATGCGEGVSVMSR